MIVVERHNTRIRPQHRMITQNVRPIRIIWIGRREKGHVVGLRVCPALLKRRMPERKVLQPEDFPHAVLFDVLILVYAALPPLYQPTRVCVLDAIVGAGRHHAPEATFGSRAVYIDVDYALHLGVIEQETVYGAIATGYEGFGETADVKTLDALFAIVATSEELNARVRVVGVELGNLITSTIASVDCTIRVLPADRGTCRDSIRMCTGAYGCPPDLKSVSTATLTIAGKRLPLNRVTSNWSFSTIAFNCSISLLIL